MDEWKLLIGRGNALFDQKADSKAEDFYLKAVSRIEALFDVWLLPDEAVGALLASYHNLAELYARGARYDEACEVYHNVHQRLVGALAKTSDTQKQCVLLSGIRSNAAYLMTFEQSLGLSPTYISHFSSPSLTTQDLFR